MGIVRRSFRDDFNEALRRLVDQGVISGFASDIDGYGPILGLNLVVKVPEPLGPAQVALTRDRVRQALADLTDNIAIRVDREATGDRGW